MGMKQGIYYEGISYITVILRDTGRRPPVQFLETKHCSDLSFFRIIDTDCSGGFSKFKTLFVCSIRKYTLYRVFKKN